MNNELLTSIENPTLAHFRHFSSLFTNPNRPNAPKSTASRHTCHSRAGGNPLRHTQYDIRYTIIENPTLAHFRHFSSLFTNFSSTTVESALQIAHFMQNKPNFQKAQMNVSDYITREYGKKDTWWSGKNKPNSNPIQTQSNPIKANKMPKQTQYKPKQTQFQRKKMLLRAFSSVAARMLQPRWEDFSKTLKISKTVTRPCTLPCWSTTGKHNLPALHICSIIAGSAVSGVTVQVGLFITHLTLI